MSTQPSVAADLAYIQLAEELRRGLRPAGLRLPGERDLAQELGVSRTTLRQALQRLADEGRVERSAQRGWFVPHHPVGEPPSVLQSFTEMARARGLAPSSHILQHVLRAAILAEAARLHVAPATPVLALRRLRGLDGVPVCLDDTVLLRSYADPLIRVDLEDRSLYDALRDECDVHVARSSYAVQATGADAEVARALELSVGDPILLGTEVTYDATERPILTSTTRYRGDAYRFTADLYRPL